MKFRATSTNAHWKLVKAWTGFLLSLYQTLFFTVPKEKKKKSGLQWLRETRCLCPAWKTFMNNSTLATCPHQNLESGWWETRNLATLPGQNIEVKFPVGGFACGQPRHTESTAYSSYLNYIILLLNRRLLPFSKRWCALKQKSANLIE